MKMEYSKQKFQWVDGSCVNIEKCVLCNVTPEYEMGCLNNIFCKSKKICECMTWQVFSGWEEWSEKEVLMWWLDDRPLNKCQFIGGTKKGTRPVLPVSYFWLHPFPLRLTNLYIQIYSFVLFSQIHLRLEGFSDHPRSFLSCLNTSRTLTLWHTMTYLVPFYH